MPTYAVSITAADYPTVNLGSALDSLTLTSGSSDGIEQPNPSVLAMSFLGSPSLAGTTYPASWWLGKKITVVIQPSDTTDYITWRGSVTSVDVRSQNATGSTLLIDITAYSNMSILSAQNIDLTGLSAGLTIADRINYVNDRAKALLWNELDNITTWSQWSYIQTWAQADSTRPFMQINYDYVTTAMPVDIAPDALGATDALTYLQNLAMSVNGWVYESNGGDYVNFRPWIYGGAGAPSPTAFDVSTCAIGTDISTSIDTSRIVNEFTVVPLGDPIYGTVTYGDPNSMQDYGYRPITLQINNYAYPVMVYNYLYRYNQPYTNLSTLTLDVDLVPAAKKIEVMFMGQPKRYDLTGIPTAFGGNQTMESRGATLNLTYNSATVELRLVPKNFWYSWTTWYQATGAWSSFATSTSKWTDVI